MSSDSNRPLAAPRSSSPARVREAIHGRGIPNDDDFDQHLPEDLRMISTTYWTPLVVVARVAAWLDEFQVRNIVDIGSGAGKFCVAAALRSSATFVGIEHRPALVAAARDLAKAFGVERRVTFEVGTLTAVPAADAYYLYNPFGENQFGPSAHVDETVELSDRRFIRDVVSTEYLLARAKRGTYAIIYNGFGGRVPRTFRRVRVGAGLPRTLELWKKTVAESEMWDAVR
jgi:predicted RNA methylase